MKMISQVEFIQMPKQMQWSYNIENGKIVRIRTFYYEVYVLRQFNYEIVFSNSY